MRQVILVLFLAALQIFGQKVTVVSDVPVTELKEGAFYYPAVSPDGKSLLFTSESYKGLWSRNLTNGRMVKVSDAQGAGYEPGFSSETNEIFYRADKFVNGKRYSSLLAYDAALNKSVVIEEGLRDLKIYREDGGKFQKYVVGSEVRSPLKQSMLKKSSAPDRVVFIQDSKIVLMENNEKKILQPLGSAQYIWVSLSPDKSKLLFTTAGKGTYITALDGTILKRIGYANYPSWSPDGNWILFMKDIDDGIKVLSSDLYIANLTTGKYFNLTSARDVISMYPKWGATNTEIFYNTVNGQIRKINFKHE